MQRNLSKVICLILAVGTILMNGCSKPDNRITLKLYYSFSPQVASYIAGVCKNYEAEHPDIRIKPEVGTRNYYMKLQTMMAGGTAPDIIYMQNKSLADYRDRGVLLNLSPYIERDNYDLSDICKLGFEEGDIKKGEVYGIPVTGSAEVLIYNKDLFDKVGLKYPDEAWTWSDMLAAARKLTRDTNGDGRLDQYGISCVPGWWASDIAWIWANGGEVFSRDLSKCVVNNARAQEGIQFLVDLSNRYNVTPRRVTGTEVSDVTELFMLGRLGMYAGLPYQALSDFSTLRNLNWDTTLMPRSNRGTRVSRYTGEGWSVYSGSKHPQEAWNLVKYLSSGETAVGLAKLNMIPARQSVLNSPAFIKEQTPYREEMIVKALEEARPVPSLPRIEELNSVWFRYIEAMMMKRATAAQALAGAEREINIVLTEYKNKRNKR
ncbi:MAG: sugar ABC transporter substrate-binding protein [bacterium]|nr:sugar ABC transporter substrate-binding protein [bacterium]